MRGRRLGLWLMVGLALALMAGPAGAISIIDPQSQGTFFTFSQTDVNQNNIPFWDGNSSDSGANDYNIGHYILGYDPDGGGPVNPGPGVGFTTPQYYAVNTGANGYDTHFYFVDGDITVKLTLEIAGFSGQNTFGYIPYDPVNNTYGLAVQIFSGGDQAGKEETVNLPKYFVFYLTSPQGTFTTLGGGAHFAIFRDGDNIIAPFVWYIGMEDLKDLGDKDYQDMVVKITFDKGGGVVPLPSSVLLLGSGLVGLLAVRNRIRFRR